MTKLTKEQQADLRNKLTTIAQVLEEVAKVQFLSPQFIKLALKNFDHIEKGLESFDLKNKLPKIKMILDGLFESKRPSDELIKRAREDYDYIKKTLDDLSSSENSSTQHQK